MKKIIYSSLLIFTVLNAGEVSTVISESIVNEYFNILGDHQIFAGKKGSQALWSIKNPRVRFNEGSAEFLATVMFEKDKVHIKKDIKRSIEVGYNDKLNEVQLLIANALVKMERRGKILGKLDLSLIYQTGLVFSGPKPPIDFFKMKTKLGKIKFDILVKDETIYFENGQVRFALDIDYTIF
jgi:hypothetical protein